MRNRLLRLAAVQNPEFYKAHSMRLSTYDKPRVIACAEDHGQHVGLPRGCLDEVNRARSATEAFLFRRLETLPETKERFWLNVALPIPFDGQSRLEVDLLCPDARIAVELDGAQHLADPIAYRRDRRKDQLLQENDYFVLRFLAEDVAKETSTSCSMRCCVRSAAGLDSLRRRVP